MKSRIYLVALVGLALMLVGSEAWAVCYVDQNAKGKNDGSTWTNAYVHPQLALVHSCTEIWVAKGVYTPVLAGSDPTISFEIPAGTKMYGGFAGGESSVDQRLPSINPTVLSGDVRNDDDDSETLTARNPEGIRGANSFHVVIIDAVPSTARQTQTLDGFFVIGGDARDFAMNSSGGGIDCEAGDTTNECSPILSNLFVVGNSAFYGAGIALNGNTQGVNSIILNSVFVNNRAGFDGGAVYLNHSPSSGQPKIENDLFQFNDAGSNGGAVMDNGGGSNYINCTFLNNTIDRSVFGGEYRGGALYIGGATSVITNTTFEGNSAREGGAIYAGGTGVPLALQNTVLWNDVADTGSELALDSRSFDLIDDSVIQNGCPMAASCTHIASSDPKLIPVGQIADGSFVLSPAPGGSAYDSGNDSACPLFDQRGVQRPQGLHCDIGAAEWRAGDDDIFKNGFQ